MAEFSFEDLITSLSVIDTNKEYRSHKISFIQLLCNFAADNLDEIESNEQIPELFQIIFLQLGMKTNSSEIINSILVLLANLTVSEQISQSLIRWISVGENSHSFERILDGFLNYFPQQETTLTDEVDWVDLDPWQYASSVICNMVRFEEIRNLILKPSTNYFDGLALQIGSRNDVRRSGAIGSIRSCLFDQEVHWWAINETCLVRSLLIPLVTPTPFTEQEKVGMDPLVWIQAERPDKSFEPLPHLRLMLVETFILLCQRRVMRDELRRRKVYPVVRNLDLAQEGEEISQAILELVNFLMRDEETLTHTETQSDQSTAVTPSSTSIASLSSSSSSSSSSHVAGDRSIESDQININDLDLD